MAFAHPISSILKSSRRRRKSSSPPPLASYSKINGGKGLISIPEELLNNDYINKMNDEVQYLCMEYPNLRDDPEFVDILNDYFNTSGEVTNLCAFLRNCLETAKRHGCALMDHNFKAEKKKIYGRGLLLEDNTLRCFNKAGYYDNEDLPRKYMACGDNIVDMIAKLEKIRKISTTI